MDDISWFSILQTNSVRKLTKPVSYHGSMNDSHHYPKVSQLSLKDKLNRLMSQEDIEVIKILAKHMTISFEKRLSFLSNKKKVLSHTTLFLISFVFKRTKLSLNISGMVF